MDTHNLLHFLTVAKNKSMTEAAKQLGVSQSSLSQSIKKLEQSIGVPLFDRNGRSLSLNSYGKTLLVQTETAFRSMENAAAAIRDASDSGMQIIRFIARQPMGDHTRTLDGFFRQYPSYALTYITPNEQTRVSDYDIEFFASAQPQPKLDNLLKICDEEYVVLVGAQHPLAKQRQNVELRSLKNERFIISPAESEMSSITSKMFEECRYTPKQVALVSNYWDVMCLVEQGVGICLATNITWLANVKLEVVPIPIADVHKKRSLYLRWPPQAYLSDATLALIDYLKTTFAQYSHFSA